MIQAWSWQDLQDTYGIYATIFQEYAGFAKRCHVPKKIDIKYSDAENSFILRFWGELNRINEQLLALDREIARRNKLVGVL